MSTQSCLPSTYLLHSIPYLCIHDHNWLKNYWSLSSLMQLVQLQVPHFQAATTHHWCKPHQEIDIKRQRNSVVSNSPRCDLKKNPKSFTWFPDLLQGQSCMFTILKPQAWCSGHYHHVFCGVGSDHIWMRQWRWGGYALICFYSDWSWLKTLAHAVVATSQSQGSHNRKQTLFYHLFESKWSII